MISENVLNICSKCLILKWWPETGSVSLPANRICNLQILKGAERAKSARMPKRSCKSLAKSIFAFANMAMGKSCSCAHRTQLRKTNPAH
jgi:hypothetical protein